MRNVEGGCILIPADEGAEVRIFAFGDFLFTDGFRGFQGSGEFTGGRVNMIINHEFGLLRVGMPADIDDDFGALALHFLRIRRDR